ncbi:MAG TPA: rRNA (cytidine-2'-O-)-methyltransferase, partial [Myxococcota bacterium]|nr:rRNA (cytidine-2'-O-)-methyltransferase [Myxococcota bacterium]
LHETFERGALGELAERFADGTRGEVTIVIEGAPPPAAPDVAELASALRAALAAGQSARDAARDLAAAYGVPRREAYALALSIRSGAGR